MAIRQNLFEAKLNQFIVEELGISNEVTYEVLRISKEFIEKIESNKERNVINKDIKSSINNFTTKIFNEKVFVTINSIYFLNQGIYQDYKDKGFVDDMGSSGVQIFPNRNKKIIRLSINCFIVNGVLQRGFYDTLQHEVSHIYQQLKANKSYPITNDYLKAKTIIYDSAKSNDEKNVALIIYFLGCGELTAYENGLYQFLKNSEDGYKDNSEIMEDVYNSSLYKFYQIADFCITNIDSPKIQNSLKDFRITKDKFLKMCHYTKWIIMKSIGRLIVKFKNDYMTEGRTCTYNPYTKLKNFYLINEEN
jgi:hypothetical protein